MSLTSVLDVIAVLVLLGVICRLMWPVWQSLECPACGLKIRFRGVTPDEEKSLQARMHAHARTHMPEGINE